MELKGKKIAFLGDSITEGHGVADPANIFWNQLARMTGAEVYGYGIGGTRIAKQHSLTDDLWGQDFCSRIDAMIPDADVVVVFGGTNDFGHGDAPMGSPADTDNTTFCGALNVLFTRLYERYPNAQLVVMTPLHRLSEDEGTWNERGIRAVGTLKDYVNQIRRAAEYYSVPVLDLYAVSGMQPKVPVLQEKYMPDGLHPNDAGHALIANKLAGFLKTL